MPRGCKLAGGAMANAGRAVWIPWVLTSALVCAATPADARGFRVGQTPNGSGFSCGLCHSNNNGGGARNAFGLDVEQSLVDGNVSWAAVYDLDPDNDGYTNGEELGDPDGTWRIGDPHPRVAASNPNDPGSFPLPCGNGVIEVGEQCDVGDLDDVDCASLGFLGGELGCAVDCSYDTAECNNCGNGFAEAREECDGDDLGDSTCVTLGFGSGELGCSPGCTLDASGCSDCGNGVRDGVEECDLADLDGQTCVSLGYESGTILCTADCRLNTEPCAGDPALVCGDGLRSGTEECDGDDLAGASCTSLALGVGTLGCRVDCSFDLSGCVSESADVQEDTASDAGADPDALAHPDGDAFDAGADDLAFPGGESSGGGCDVGRGPSHFQWIFTRGR